MFLFACYAAFLPRKEVVSIFGGDLYAKRKRLPLIKRILGIEGFKPLDCVGEPEEMILAMEYAARRGEYSRSPAMRLFRKRFPSNFDFRELEQEVLSESSAAH